MGWLVWTIIKVAVGFIVGFIFKDYIKEKLYFIVIILSKVFGRRSKVKGLWLASFKYPDVLDDSGELITYHEVVRLYSAFNFVVGVIVPHDQNGERAAELSNRTPLRVLGSIKDNSHFTGNWYHPEDNFNFYGAFQLNILPSNIQMNGRWIGFNTSRNIGCNEWVWKKIQDSE
jgi:hypothetical protein